MTCTTCQAPAEQYLCPACVRDLAAWLAKGRDLLPELDVTVLRQDVVRKAGSEGANGTRTQGSAAPLNIDAWQVREDLRVDLGMSADQYAQDVWAVGEVARVIANIQHAELLISGPEEPPIDHAGNRERVKEIAPPMPTRQLLPWLRENARITITRADINNWRQRGHLRPVDREPSPTYHPHEVVELWNRKERA